MNSKSKSLFQLHIAVLLFGLSGLFGKLVHLSPLSIVFGRVLFSSVFLLLIIVNLKKKLKLNQSSHYICLVIMGIILSVHWFAFFKSIQVSTIAVGLSTFSTFPIFVTFLEPFFFRERLKFRDIVLALIAFMGVLIVVSRVDAYSNIIEGALWGIASGLTYGVLSIINRKYVKEYSSLVITFYEQVIAALALAPFILVQRPVFQTGDILLLALLGVVFTAVSHSLFIGGLKHIRAHAAGIISSLEPVYGIIFAALFLGELPSFRELFGGAIIIGTGFYSMIKEEK